MIAEPVCLRRVRSSRAGTGGAEAGQPRGPERNPHHPAATRAANFGCPHKMGFLRERGGDKELVGLAPGGPLPWEGWGRHQGCFLMGRLITEKIDENFLGDGWVSGWLIFSFFL